MPALSPPEGPILRQSRQRSCVKTAENGPRSHSKRIILNHSFRAAPPSLSGESETQIQQKGVESEHASAQHAKGWMTEKAPQQELTRRITKDGTASISNDSDTSASWSASICVVELRHKRQSLTSKNRMDGCDGAAFLTSLLNSAQGSAHGAQKLRQDTRCRSAERRVLKWSGEVTETKFDEDEAMVGVLFSVSMSE